MRIAYVFSIERVFSCCRRMYACSLFVCNIRIKVTHIVNRGNTFISESCVQIEVVCGIPVYLPTQLVMYLCVANSRDLFACFLPYIIAEKRHSNALVLTTCITCENVTHTTDRLAERTSTASFLSLPIVVYISEADN